MRKMLVVFPTLFVALFSVSCGNKAQLETQNLADSLARVDSINAVEAAEYATWQKDSVEKVNKKTFDLTFFEVHGPVHVISRDGLSIVFDKEGNLTQLNGYDPFTADPYSDFEHPKTKYIRDNKGRIVTEQGWESEVTYVWDGDVLVKNEWGAESMIGSTIYSYDEKGCLVQRKDKESVFDGSEASSSTTNYTYLDIDKYGNWTKRKGGSYTESRTISYYPLKRPGSSSSFNPDNEVYNFSGKIGTDAGCVLEVSPGGGYYTVSNGRRSVRFNSYDESTGILVIDAYANNTDKYIGKFEGKFDKQSNLYTGTFTNTSGGQVSFELSME